MNIIGIIPARYASTRFPGKPLIKIKGKYMIQHVYERVSNVLETVIVATDDKRIFDAVNKFGGKAIMTSPEHKSGTDRCAEALEKHSKKSNIIFDVVINIQGDEPFIHKEHIEKLKTCFEDNNTQIATLIKPINDTETIFNPNSPKVIINNKNEAIYFSRSPIPFVHKIEKNEWHKKAKFYKHLGIYGYNIEILKQITKIKQSSLEIAESLEQNRWIENGYSINVAITNIENYAIDTPNDLEVVLKFNNKNTD